MALQKTSSGWVEFISSWGHGKETSADLNRTDIVIRNDGDGHYEAWSYTGDEQDALQTLASLDKNVGGNYVAVRNFNGYCVEPAPLDFWIEQNDEIVPNTIAYPNIIAW